MATLKKSMFQSLTHFSDMNNHLGSIAKIILNRFRCDSISSTYPCPLVGWSLPNFHFFGISGSSRSICRPWAIKHFLKGPIAIVSSELCELISREENIGGGGRLEDTDSEEDILDYLEEEAEDDSDEDICDAY